MFGKGADNRLSIPWPSVAIGAVLVAVAAATGLAIVASVKHAEALTSVALAVAIFAFVMQIVVFIAQTWASSQVNAETRAFLTELRTRTEGTERTLSGQVDKLTDHLMQVSAATQRKGIETPSEARERVRQQVEQIVAPEPDLSSLINPRRVDSRALSEFRRYPSRDDGIRALEILDSLSALEVGRLQVFADDHLESLELGILPGLSMEGGYGGPATQALLNRGLLEPINDQPTQTSAFVRLTEQGKIVARLLIGQGVPPSYLSDSSDMTSRRP